MDKFIKYKIVIGDIIVEKDIKDIGAKRLKSVYTITDVNNNCIYLDDTEVKNLIENLTVLLNKVE